MFAILRMEKLKHRQQIKAAMGHNLRTIPVDNADEKKSKLNVYQGASDFASLMGRMEKRFLEHNIEPRKDAVQAVEFVLSASPEFWQGKTQQEIQQWANANIAFFANKFNKQNLLSYALHQDETNPHIHLILTPITPDGRLSCKDLLGGKAKLSKLQTEYADAMKKFGLKRGIERSNAKHTTIKQFYTLANKIKKLNKEQLKEVAELLTTFESDDKLNDEIDSELNLQLLKTINKVKPYLKLSS